MKLFKLWAFLIFFTTLFLLSTSHAQAALPANFQRNLIVGSGLNGVTAFEFAPDGRIFILQRTGEIYIYKNGQLLTQPFAVLPSINSGDRGLIGIAFDPDFNSNHYVYFYYTGLDKLNRLVRFNASGDVGTDGPFILYQTTFPSEQLHVGGSIRFGPDGKLYFAVGDNGYHNNAQDLTNPHGKILRINKDGSIPLDNPFVGQTGKLPEIWAYGFRNPWRFQFDSVTGRLYVADVGEATWEEIDLIVKGGNYGWPICEGPCMNSQFINSIYTYNHDNLSAAVTIGPIYNDTMFPSSYQGNLFFADYARGFIKNMSLNADGTMNTVSDFDLGAGSVTDLKVSPIDGSLWYVTYYPGALYQITYSTGNHYPVPNASVDNNKGVSPFTVQFSSNGTTDPDNDPLTYNWNFGDGTSSTDPNPTKTYTSNGIFTVQLKVSDGTLTSSAVPLIIQVGIPPNLTIGQPTDGSKYNAGDSIHYTASAVDGAGLDIDDGHLCTTVVFHHNTHIHPFYGPVCGRTGDFVTPTTGEPASNTWFEIKVTATDTSGLSTTKSVNIYPNIANVTIDSVPQGAQLFLDGQPITTPYTFTGVVGFLREVGSTAIVVANGKYYTVDYWSDGSTSTRHFIATQSTDTTYTAYLNSSTPWKGEYFDNKTLSGTPKLTRDDIGIDFAWNDGSPDPSIPLDNFSVRWTKTQKFLYGRYKFVTATDDGVRLYIDGNLVIDKWIDEGTTQYEYTTDLSAGNHDIKMEYYENSGGAIARLSWDLTPDQPTPSVTATPTPTSTPTPTNTPTPTATPTPEANGYSAEYFNNTTLSGTPVLTRTDPAIDFVWDGGSPDPLIYNDQFSVRWTRTVNLATGTYRFTTTADDGVRIKVDGNLVIDKWIDQPSTTYINDISLTNGNHTIVMEYYENYGGAVAKMSYQQVSDPTPTPTSTPTPTPTPSTDTVYNAEYFDNKTLSGTPKITRQDQTIDFAWNDGSPDPLIPVDQFSARWTKTTYFEAGTYNFTTTADDGVRVKLDGVTIIDAWFDQGSTTYSLDKVIAEGNHTVVVEYYENYGGAIEKFSYTKIADVPAPSNVFKGEYFDNISLTGKPVLTRDDQFINFVWNDGSPDVLVPNDNFSVRWTKTQNYQNAGTYKFTIKADDGIRFWIDNQLLVDDWTDHAMKVYTPTANLTAGNHTLKIEYYEHFGGAVAILSQDN